jgi:hypothetical protein
MFTFFEYKQSDVDFTLQNLDGYNKRLKPKEKKKIRAKLSQIQPDSLNFLGRMSFIIEWVLYGVCLFAVLMAFYFYIYSSDSQGHKQMTSSAGYFIAVLFGSVLFVHALFILFRYRKCERFIHFKEAYGEGNEIDFKKRSITWLGRMMTTSWIDRYENNITGAVYFGAGFLVVVVGLRGLGERITKLGFPFPKFVIDPSGSLSLDLIFLALFLEFTLLLTLALVTFFKDEEEKTGGNGKSGNGGGAPLSINNFTELIELMKNAKLKVDFSELEGLLATMNSTITKGLMVRDQENPKIYLPYLNEINNKMEPDYLNAVFTGSLKELSTLKSQPLVEISVAINTINQAVNAISDKIKDEGLHTQLEKFNKSVRAIKETLGVKLNVGSNGNQNNPN